MGRRPLSMLATLLGLALAVTVARSDGGTTPGATSPGAQIAADAGASADARAAARLEAVKQKGMKLSAASKTRTEAKLEAETQKVDREAAAHGDATVAARLAAEFGLTADALMQEKKDLGCSWGDLMIAHALGANAGGDVTIQQLVGLKQDGMGWGQIAHGLNLNLGQVVSAARAESRVAIGLEKPDSHPAVIHVAGASAGAGAQAGAHAGAGANGTGAGAGVGVDAGLKLGVGKGKP